MIHASFNRSCQPLAPIRADVSAEGKLQIDIEALATALCRLPASAPVVAMIHGWGYAPHQGADCPHDTILSHDPLPGNARVISWPGALGLDGQNGLGIAIGWQARCGLWSAHRRARAVGAAVAGIAGIIKRLDRGRKLHLIGHSMGGRVALSALAQSGHSQIGRVILLAGAETRDRAEEAIAAPGATGAEVLNVATRENDLFDAGFEWGVHLGRGTSIGQGLGRVTPEWRDLWIDRPETCRALELAGFPLTPRAGRIDHWSHYLRGGLFRVYRAVLDGSLPLSTLPDTPPARRWSLILPGNRPRGPNGETDFGGAGWDIDPGIAAH